MYFSIVGKILVEILGAPSRENTRVKSIKITWDFGLRLFLYSAYFVFQTHIQKAITASIIIAVIVFITVLRLLGGYIIFQTKTDST